MLNIGIYNSAIRDTWIYLLLNMLPLFIGGITLIVIVIIGLFKHLMKKSILFLLLTLSVMVLSYPIIEMSVFNYDIQHTNFDVYYGEFDYMQVSGNRKDTFEFSDEPDLYVRSVADLEISAGIHTGYILYGKISRWVIAYSNIPFD